MYPIVYRKGGFVFRSLQFVLGNETFFEGLRQIVRECHYTSCGVKRIQEIFENVSNQDLDWFFEEWFYSAKVPDYEVKNFTIVQNNGKYLLNFEIIDRNNFTMLLEVKVETEGRGTVKRIWIKGKARITIECEGKPLAVILDPHEWMINENKEYQINGVKIVVE
ncbi:M1 family aminopeptidase [Thermococcus barophilus]|uniref:M1 family aminopeptidase n=1 Tax=Thermococcus barophilus TaxID=55802 RepID=UPI0011AE4442|nr:M1 family aminopeptidase [Thermococcus barophilus]